MAGQSFPRTFSSLYHLLKGDTNHFGGIAANDGFVITLRSPFCNHPPVISGYPGYSPGKSDHAVYC
ncbi:hypothetical protein AR543_00050 [Paenibacillus bovis]|uniref:Uncharacterized protein n=1 Tax=Paenibacillus bovis TaxID=1616788 RepID=A0A172ZAP2_9BACL|nr:hypothetical protein AR543_00050 [Paenibacillus bovis]